ncbi:MAG: response regulator [Candidatus Saccharibacteria bacterium]
MTKIMLVEDDKSLREIYGIRLLAEGYEIKSAGDGEEALAMAIKEKPDLIISDVMMPKISGFDMLDILRATPETKDVKVIMMTALSSEDQRARGESLGANRYLVKSQVGIEDVVRTVHDVLSDAPNIGAAAPQQPPTSAFGAPASSAIIAPRPFALPPQPAPVPAYAPQPIPAPAPVPAPQAPTSFMPQPTAPFSSPAPASLGDSFMNPVKPVEPIQQPTVESAPSEEQFTPQHFSLPAQPQFDTAPQTETPQQPAIEPATLPSVDDYASQPTEAVDIPTFEPVAIPVTEPATSPTATQPREIIAPQPIPSGIPDMGALMAQELSNHEQTPQQ